MSKLRLKSKKPAASAKSLPAKPLTLGTVLGHVAEVAPRPPQGVIKRYIITSAQNNTKVHEPTWENLQALAKYYNAEILVGIFKYNKGAYGQERSAKQQQAVEKDEWYDPRVVQYFKNHRVTLGAGLDWCGEINIIPTAGNPLSRFETYSGRHSAIFPHAKIAMRSVAALQGSGAKLNYTTGTVTQRNYIQRKEGFLGEFHHTYGGLIVEVDSNGIWGVRQLDAEDVTGTIYDLTLKVEKGKVTTGHRVEALIPGDIHATIIHPDVLALLAIGKGSMMDVLQPRHVAIHDLLEGASVNHHDSIKPLERYRTNQRGLTSIEQELLATADVLEKFYREDSKIIVVNSNHDRWLDRFLDGEHRDAAAENLPIYFDGNLARLDAVKTGRNRNVMEYLIRKYGKFQRAAKFLNLNNSYVVCGKIELGQHGDFGPNGSKGSPTSLSKSGRRAVTAHSHVAGIWDGLYVVGTSTQFDMRYNNGPSSWTHTHCIVYPNGKRTLVTMFNNEWRRK